MEKKKSMIPIHIFVIVDAIVLAFLPFGLDMIGSGKLFFFASCMFTLAFIVSRVLFYVEKLNKIEEIK